MFKHESKFCENYFQEIVIFEIITESQSHNDIIIIMHHLAPAPGSGHVSDLVEVAPRGVIPLSDLCQDSLNVITINVFLI